MLPKTMKASLVRASYVAGFLAFFLPASANQPIEVAVVGAAESIDCASRTVQVLGIKFKASSAADAAALCASGSPSDLVYVAISGHGINADFAEITKYQVISKGAYVPGATPVYLSGPITAADSKTGQITVRGARVVQVNAYESVGANVELIGIQPVLGELVLPSTLSSTGSGVLSSAGPATFSSTGSGRLSSKELSLLSSTGSGRQSSTGSGVFSSTGSGRQSSTGSGVFSSTGFGRGSSTGSGVLSSTGSGRQSSTGSGIMSSTGSGRSGQSASAELSSSTGSGRAAE